MRRPCPPRGVAAGQAGPGSPASGGSRPHPPLALGSSRWTQSMGNNFYHVTPPGLGSAGHCRRTKPILTNTILHFNNLVSPGLSHQGQEVCRMPQSPKKVGTGRLIKPRGRTHHIPHSSKRKLDSDKLNHGFKAVQIPSGEATV